MQDERLCMSVTLEISQFDISPLNPESVGRTIPPMSVTPEMSQPEIVAVEVPSARKHLAHVM